MKRSYLTLLLAAAVLTGACSDDDNTGPEGEARIRVVHASPDAPDVDVLLDEAEVLSEALGDKIKVDVETARRLFTLVCALHVRG